jgi:dTDP-4-amino-4,6-dideoxygalactose transaminase
MSKETHRSVSIAAPSLDDREIERVSAVLESGSLAAGERVREFEDSFAAYCETEHAVATTNGTAALHTALRAAGVEPGDAVVTTPFSFVASANAIRLAGAEPIFADIDHETYSLDPHAVEATIRRHDGDVDALLVVHLYGLPAAMDHLGEIASRYDLTVIEDACQAHGAEHDGVPVGALGDAGCFSFYPTKNMTTAEGGMVVTDDDGIAERASRFIDHGRTGSYRHADLGHNYRLTNVAAAIGEIQLEKLPAFNRARRANAERLADQLTGLPIELPVEPPGRRHVYNQFTIRTQRREELRDHLSSVGIDSAVYYPEPIHRQPAYDHVSASAPVAERTATEVLSLPVHPELSEADVDAVGRAVRSAFEATGDG